MNDAVVTGAADLIGKPPRIAEGVTTRDLLDELALLGLDDAETLILATWLQDDLEMGV